MWWFFSPQHTRFIPSFIVLLLLPSLASMPAKKSTTTEKPVKATRTAKPKKDVDPDKPKRTPSPFIIFCSEKRSEVREQNPDASFGDVGKILGALWTGLDEKSKAVRKKILDFNRFHTLNLNHQPYVKEAAKRKSAALEG